MKVIFYKKDNLKHFSIEPTQHNEKVKSFIWLANELGEGGQFDADEVTNVIYEALERYFYMNI